MTGSLIYLDLVQNQNLRTEIGKVFLLQCHLIYGSDIANDLRDRLEWDDLAIILKSKHRPHCIIEFISQSIRLMNLEDAERNNLVNHNHHHLYSVVRICGVL